MSKNTDKNLMSCLVKAKEFKEDFERKNAKVSILSRKKQQTITQNNPENNFKKVEDFFTLHSLVYKVLPKDSLSNLNGELMFDNVRDAFLECVPKANGLEKEELEQLVMQYYQAIREHKSESSIVNNSLSQLEFGKAVLSNYNKINTTWDWEDSFKMATYYLHGDYSLREEIDYTDFIILGMDLLEEYRDKNALDFLNAFVLWGIRNNKDWKFWVIKPGKPELLHEMHVYFDEPENHH